MPITASFAAVLALMFIGLSVLVIRRRIRLRVSLGDGGQGALQKATRAHGNFAEYVPFSLILMAGLELQGAPVWAVVALGLGLIIGRIAHAYAILAGKIFGPRQLGMGLTFTVLTVAALGNLALSLPKLVG